MIFNNIDKDYLIVLRGRKRPAWAPVYRDLVSVTGMSGAHLSNTDTKVRLIYVPIYLKADNIGDLQKIKEDLAEWLIHDEPKPLIFKDEPDRTYFAVVDGSLDLDELVRWGEGVITFICPDPYKYGPEQTTEPSSDTFIVENEGTAETHPIITLTAKEPTTFAMVSNGDEYMMIGRPYDVDEIPTEQYPLVQYFPFESLIGWSHMTEGYLLDDEVSGGVVSNGSIEVYQGVAFQPSSFGTERPGWYGPAIRRSLPESIGDFRITFGTTLYGDGKGVGKIMAIFLDEDDDIVASIGLINSRRGTRNVRVLARMNDGKNIRRTRIMDYPGDSGNESTVFSGRPLNIQLTREGNRFHARTFQVRDGRQHARHAEEKILDIEEYQRPIRQVVMYFAKYGSVPPLSMRALGLGVRKNNTLQMDEDNIPYIAMQDDEIIFDHMTGDAYVNGESVPFDFGADFFTLKKGINELAVLPEGVFDTRVKYRERYK